MNLLKLIKWDCIRTVYRIGWIFAVGIFVFLLRFIMPITIFTQNTLMPLMQMISTTLLAVVMFRSYIIIIIDFTLPTAIAEKTVDKKGWQIFLSKWLCILLVNWIAALMIYSIMIIPKHFPLTESGLFIPIATIAHFMINPVSILGGAFNAMLFGLIYVIAGSFSFARRSRITFTIIMCLVAFVVCNQLTEFLCTLIAGMTTSNLDRGWFAVVFYILYSVLCIAASSYLWKNRYDIA